MLVVVARWFGGTKLGAGGLVRAYGGAAAECLRIADKIELRPLARLRLAAGFDHLGAVYATAARFEAEVLCEQHHDKGAEWQLELLATERERFLRALGDATRGQARILTDVD